MTKQPKDKKRPRVKPMDFIRSATESSKRKTLKVESSLYRVQGNELADEEKIELRQRSQKSAQQQRMTLAGKRIRKLPDFGP